MDPRVECRKKLFVKCTRVSMEVYGERYFTLVLLDTFRSGTAQEVKEYRDNYRRQLERKLRATYRVIGLVWTRMRGAHTGWRLELTCVDTRSHEANCSTCLQRFCNEPPTVPTLDASTNPYLQRNTSSTT